MINYYPPMCHFTMLGQENAQNMAHYYNVQQGKNTTQTLTNNSGITNSLFDGLTYNMWEHFAHCSELEKYPRVLYVKPSSQVYILLRYSSVCLLPATWKTYREKVQYGEYAINTFSCWHFFHTHLAAILFTHKCNESKHLTSTSTKCRDWV